MALVVVDRPSEHVALVRLNRPEAMNALNLATRRELVEAFRALSADDDVRCVVVTGNEKAFAAGADLKEMADMRPRDWLRIDVRRLWKVVADCPHPVIAAVNGFALGGGCELAMHADIIIAGEGARFGQPEVRVGIMAGGGGTQRLTRAVGKYKAMKMLLTGEMIDARTADAMGLVSEVVADDQVVTRALEIARTIAALPPLAIRYTKEAVLAGGDSSLEAGLMLERRIFDALFDTDDQKEGMRAFAEKRKPQFRGE
jgi:enoyl-CoA hydratase